MAEPLVLFDYWRSSACYRVRICLHLKGLEFEQRQVNLAPGSDEQRGEEYLELNPQGLVPALRHGEALLTQSLAICEYLDELCPEPPLLPADPLQRAQARAVAFVVACDIHPINNLRIQVYLKERLGVSAQGSVDWMNHWMGLGFQAIENRLATGKRSGNCCFGDEPGLADACLVPQVYNAERFGCDLSGFPRIMDIVSHCRAIPAFAAAAPEAQPDAPSG